MSIARAVVKAFWDCLYFYERNRGAPLAARILQYFVIWRGLHSATVNISEEGRSSLRNLALSLGIQVRKNEELDMFLFVLETYLATLMKLILLQRRGVRVVTIADLRSAFSQMRGLIEEDLFEWFTFAYEDSSLPTELIERLESSFKILSESLWDLELGRIDFDLFREIYQNIVSPEIRRSLGEFYTNEQIVKEVLDACHLTEEEIQQLYKEYETSRSTADTIILDPACGSGTFLIIVVERIVKALKAIRVDDHRICDFISKNVVGIDINPFAVYMAKLNMLLKLAQLLPTCQPATLQIIWADSLSRYQDSVTVTGLPSIIIQIPFLASFMPTRTAKGPDYIELPHPGNFMPLEKLIDLVENYVRTGGGVQALINHLNRIGGAVTNNLGGYMTLIEELYTVINYMYQSGNSRLVRLLKNVAKVIELKGRCRYVIGNPPWVRVHNIDKKVLNYLKRNYTVFDSRKTYKPDFGKTKVPFVVQFDYSMAFVEAGLEYLTDEGLLSYVITSKITQTTYAGELRRKLLTETMIVRIVDYSLYKVALFRDAVNYPLIIAVKKTNPPDGHEVDITIYNTIGESRSFKQPQQELPLYSADPRSPWILAPPPVLRAFRKMQNSGARLGDLYEIMMGVKTAANDLYLVKNIRSVIGNIAEVELEGGGIARVEKDLLMPLVRGADIDPFNFKVSGLIIFTHDSNGDVLCDADQRKVLEVIASEIRKLLPRNGEITASSSGTCMVYEAGINIRKLAQNLRTALLSAGFAIKDVQPCIVFHCWEVLKQGRRVLRISLEDTSNKTRVYIDGLEIPGNPQATQHFLTNVSRLIKRDDYKVGQPPWIIFRVSKEKLKDKVAWQEIAKHLEATLLPASYTVMIGEHRFNGFLIPLQKVYFVTPKERKTGLALLLYLNSPLIRSFMKLIAYKARGGFFEHISASMGHLPIPCQVSKLTQFLDELVKDGTEVKDWSEILEAVGNLAQNAETKILETIRSFMDLSEEEAKAMIEYSDWLNPIVEEHLEESEIEEELG